MGVQYLDTSGFHDAAKAASDAILAFNSSLEKMQEVTNKILDRWVGRGRNEFETQVYMISVKLEDISDELYDLYNAIVEAQKTFIDADIAEAKARSIDGSGAN